MQALSKSEFHLSCKPIFLLQFYYMKIIYTEIFSIFPQIRFKNVSQASTARQKDSISSQQNQSNCIFKEFYKCHHSCKIVSSSMIQANPFSSLGFYFSASTRKQPGKITSMKIQSVANGILHFASHNGNKYVSTFSKVYRSLCKVHRSLTIWFMVYRWNTI